MKSLGVEFLNYACFERCFVPLDAGVRLLVGRNNSGKTALLRGIATRRALPFRGRGSFDAGVSRYSRVQTPYPRHSLHIYFEYQEADNGYLGQGIATRPRFKTAKNVRWKFSFTVLPQNAAILFDGAEILFDEEKAIVLLSRKNDVLRYNYNPLEQLFAPQTIAPSTTL